MIKLILKQDAKNANLTYPRKVKSGKLYIKLFKTNLMWIANWCFLVKTPQNDNFKLCLKLTFVIFTRGSFPMKIKFDYFDLHCFLFLF